jgi:glycosyltransferase involved in cell wall biosynthesis
MVTAEPKAPAFSVIIPTYNRQRVLAECLDALGRQSVRPEMFEVIVVDDGSTDEKEQFCRDFQPNYSFRYLRQLHAGAARRAARARAIPRAPQWRYDCRAWLTRRALEGRANRRGQTTVPAGKFSLFRLRRSTARWHDFWLTVRSFFRK